MILLFLIPILSCDWSTACSSCPVLECWFVQEKTGRGGGLAAATTLEKSLLHIQTDPHPAESQQAPSDIHPDRVYLITDPAGTLCHRSLNPPRGSVEKPQCEINPFLPQPSTLKWASPLTDSASSPIYLQADWFSTALKGLNGQLAVSTITRAPTATKEPVQKTISVPHSKCNQVFSRLGGPVLLDCGLWANPSSPLSGSGFAVEWRYQFRGDGRLVLAYDGKTDRLADVQEEGATLDYEGLHQRGNASLILREAKVRHSGLYICTVYLPYLVAQVTMELQVVGFSSPSIEDSMAMVGVALVLYGLIKFASWTVTSSGNKGRRQNAT
uniref:Ig-like domain-containing protein n=1 Tax=Gasterosteus aculeatus aculeatus TaxID=481459 RepID=A0AAQ4S6P7_GASAC